MSENQDNGKKSGREGTKAGDRENHSDVENYCEERCRFGQTISEPLQNQDRDQDQVAGRRKPALVRSKTFDHSLLRDVSQVQTDLDSKIKRKMPHYSQLSKSNCQYHKIFKEISKEEQLQQSYTCALQKDILYQGRMFVSEHWICFHSKVFGKDTKIAIPVMSITNIKKTKTALLLPNALVIATTNDRYVFVSFLARENTYKFLTSVCLHLEEKSPCSSPIPSSAKSTFRCQRSPQLPRFPLAFAEDFSVLDRAVIQRRQETEESSSSDSQTPDYNKIAEFPVPPFLNVLKHTESPPSPKLSEHQPMNHQQNQTSSERAQLDSQEKGLEIVINDRDLKPISLNTLLCIYLLLVCMLMLSSCYLAFKIVSLEQRLSTLGSISEFTEQHDVLRTTSDLNADLFSELITINLIKLEKVQRNLQRLLDEAA